MKPLLAKLEVSGSLRSSVSRKKLMPIRVWELVHIVPKTSSNLLEINYCWPKKRYHYYYYYYYYYDYDYDYEKCEHVLKN